jgi:hypothetical protein
MIGNGQSIYKSMGIGMTSVLHTRSALSEFRSGVLRNLPKRRSIPLLEVLLVHHLVHITSISPWPLQPHRHAHPMHASAGISGRCAPLRRWLSCWRSRCSWPPGGRRPPASPRTPLDGSLPPTTGAVARTFAPAAREMLYTPSTLHRRQPLPPPSATRVAFSVPQRVRASSVRSSPLRISTTQSFRTLRSGCLLIKPLWTRATRALESAELVTHL